MRRVKSKAMPQASPNEPPDLNSLNYRVRGLSFSILIDVMDNQGRLDKRVNSQPQELLEAHFFPGLKDWIKSLGFGKGLAPEEEQK